MIAIDTNLLVYAHRPETSLHQRARETLSKAVLGSEPVCVPLPCIHEFLASLCLFHGVHLCSADRDSSRFPDLSVVNPLARV